MATKKIKSRALYDAGDFERRHRLSNPEPYRSESRRDAARILHSPCFRRLQGKMQLFPCTESDYFRNRLTHSLEVGQVAKSIAIRLNYESRDLKACGGIDEDFVEAAGWAHDLGHPPFGHQGEEVLDNLMCAFGGFEGNAQTLRILTRLEKRNKTTSNTHGFDGNGDDQRLGLNLTARMLAAVLKYDKPIPILRPRTAKVTKGYYKTESSVVAWLKERVAPGVQGPIKTLECCVMDVADDIAYSVYDLEDALKASFLSPLGIISAPEAVVEKVAEGVSRSTQRKMLAGDVRHVLDYVFGECVGNGRGGRGFLAKVKSAFLASEGQCANGYLRYELTSKLLAWFIGAVRLRFDALRPQLSTVVLDAPMDLVVETLKHLTFVSLIESSRVQVASFRAHDVLSTVFETLTSEKGHRLLPSDVLMQWEATDGLNRRRVVCDFMAGMTDRYALEFFGRLRSESPQTIFKPI